MQDVHWTDGAVRLLPELHAGRDVRGAVVRGACAAPCRTSTRASRRGDLAPVFDWLRDAHLVAGEPLGHTDELVRRASGEALNPAHFRAHLEARYGNGPPP